MICHDYKCIFIHIPKVAGQSIETIFLNLLGLTWKTRAPLLLRKNDCPEIGPPRLAHLTINEYIQYKYLSEDLFDDYYKFSFVRNPWDRVVSIYHYLGYDRKFIFGEFVLNHLHELLHTYYWFLKPQKEFITTNNNIMVDFIGRYENLQSDFDIVCKKLGIEDSALIHKNKSKRNFNEYKAYYNSTSKDLVYKIYKQDVKLFKYEF
jgi:hypothetical protein